MSNIRRKAERDGIELTDEYIANEMASYMETNPACVDMNESNREGRYYYSTVGYGVFSLLGLGIRCYPLLSLWYASAINALMPSPTDPYLLISHLHQVIGN